MSNNSNKKECIVIMPIEREHKGYETNHFRDVYEHLISPSVKQAGYLPLRVDEINPEIIDYTEIINKIMHAPMAIFDLSTWDERIITGLKIREAFNRPTIVISDIYAPVSFESNRIKYLEYKKELSYPLILYIQLNISSCIKELSDQKVTYMN